MEEDALESSSEEGSSLDEPSWVSWFCMLRNHEFFCEVDPAFVQDRFNLYGLKEIVGPLYGEAMTMILGYAPTGALSTNAANSERTLPAFGTAPWLLCALAGWGLRAREEGARLQPTRSEADVFLSLPNAEKQLSDPTQRIHKVLETARILYGLIHARYVLTAQGLTDMVRRLAWCWLCTRARARSLSLFPARSFSPRVTPRSLGALWHSLARSPPLPRPLPHPPPPLALPSLYSGPSVPLSHRVATKVKLVRSFNLPASANMIMFCTANSPPPPTLAESKVQGSRIRVVPTHALREADSTSDGGG